MLKKVADTIKTSEVAKTLRHLGLDPWIEPPGGGIRSILDGHRPADQHLAMVLSTLKARLDSTEKSAQVMLEARDKYLNRILDLKGVCVSESDHGLWCEEELKIKGSWCPTCRALDSAGISQVRKRRKKTRS